jgi:hypothetical protein
VKIEVIYSSGQTYYEHISSGTVRVVPTKVLSDGSKRIDIRFFASRPDSKKSGEITLRLDDARRLGHALLLACSGEVEPLQFSLAEHQSKASAA